MVKEKKKIKFKCPDCGYVVEIPERDEVLSTVHCPICRVPFSKANTKVEITDKERSEAERDTLAKDVADLLSPNDDFDTYKKDAMDDPRNNPLIKSSSLSTEDKTFFDDNAADDTDYTDPKKNELIPN